MQRMERINVQQQREIRRMWSRDGLGFYEVAYAPLFEMQKHTHDSPRCVLVLKGSVRHRSSCDLECGAQSAVFVAQDEVHEDAIGKSGAQCFIVELGASLAERSSASPVCKSVTRAEYSRRGLRRSVDGAHFVAGGARLACLRLLIRRQGALDLNGVTSG